MGDLYLGIDGGKSAGAGVVIGDDLHKPIVHLFETTGKAVAWLKEIKAMGITLSVLEKATASPVMSPARAFTFGENYGGWKWALSALDIPTRIIPPKNWQKYIPGLISNDTKSAHKRKIQQYMQQLYPQIRVTQYFSDALALAEHAKHLHLLPQTHS